MKNFVSILAACGMMVSCLVSCDSVSEPDRFIPVEKKQAKRVVLIEEFTGQRCTNCPDGHVVLSNLLHQYPESVIAVGIHSLAQGYTIPAPNGLGIQLGQDYYLANGSPALPTAVINRSTKPLQMTEWAATAVYYMDIETPLSLTVDATLEGDVININVDMSSIENLDGKLQLWVTENDIVAYQLDHGKNDFNYVHNHVLRAAVNGVWGDDVQLGANVGTSMSYTQKLESDWNPEHLDIVAFVYNDSGVVQAAQCAVE